MLKPISDVYPNNNGFASTNHQHSRLDYQPVGQYYYHFPNSVDEREKEQLSQPMLHRVISSRVLYAVSLPSTRKATRVLRWRCLIVLLLLFVLAVCYGFYLANHGQAIMTEKIVILPPQVKHPVSEVNIFGVVFDAGSTGSRVNVFQLTVNHSDPRQPYVVTDHLLRQIKPGLSAYADEPAKAANSLGPLIEAAQSRLPSGSCSRTPVLLRATAGLRLLSAQKADGILAEVRKALEKSCFLKPSDLVSILEGNLEGLYVWISLNSLKGCIPSPSSINSSSLTSANADKVVTEEVRFRPEDTLGTLDLGGGSTQITFAPAQMDSLASAPPGFITSLLSGKPVVSKAALHLGSQVYSHSYLGLGLMSARYSMLHTITRRLPNQSFGANNELYSPCLPKQNQSVTWSHAGQQWTVKHLQMDESALRPADFLLPSELRTAKASLNLPSADAGADTDKESDPSAVCYALALTVLRAPVEGDSTAPLYPPTGYVIHRPIGLADHRFHVFSYLVDLATSIGIVDANSEVGVVTVGQFRDAAVRICKSQDSANPFNCMDLCFITALLHDGYGFLWEKELTLQKKVKKFEINWALGALYAELYAGRRTSTGRAQQGN